MTTLLKPARRVYRGGRTIVQTLRSFGMDSVGLAVRYAAAMPFPAGSDLEHLTASLAWLRRAQDAAGDGVAALFSLDAGWDLPYPETSGYIVATFLAARAFPGNDDLRQRAKRIGDWEIAIQAPNGGVYSRPGLPDTRVFNTGQVILGWCALYESLGDSRYLDAANRAGEYLVRLQEANGTWVRDTYCGARTYHARTDWGLLRLAALTARPEFVEAARSNLRWVMAQQQENGWFRNCGFHDEDPITHVIDYTLIGVLECAMLKPDLFDRKPAELIESSAKAICDIVARSCVGGIAGMIPASYNSEWQSADEHSCLTGNAQLAYTLFRLYRITGKNRYATCADLLLSALKRTQVLAGAPDEVRGAIPGSFPMYKGYLANSFPNWAAKFFADALLASLKREEDFAVTA